MAYLNECRFLNKPAGQLKMQFLRLSSLKLRGIKTFACIALVLFSAQGLAVEFNAIDTAKSKINFTSKLMGSTINGSFDQFGGVVNFNPDNPEKAKADIWIALASFNAGGDELRDEAQGKEWFNSKIFPRAQFVSETIKKLGIQLMVVGEFYEDASGYHDLVNALGLQDQIKFYSNYIPDGEVKNYVCSADFIIQPYKNATQSGVTPLAYHFEKPMLVTNVGGLADTVPNLKTGIVVEPTTEAIAKGIETLYEMGENHFIPNIIEEKKKYSWSQMTEKFLALYQQL